MPQNNQQGNVKTLQSILNRPDNPRSTGIAGIADHVKIAESDIKQQLNRDPGIRTAEHNGHGILGGSDLMQADRAGMGVLGLPLQKSLMACQQFGKIVSG
jgi:hypothetical protein